MSTPIDSEARLSSLEKVPSTILKPRSFAFTWPCGVFALLLLTTLSSGCARSAKVDAAPAPVVAVVNVARHDLSNKLEIASEFQPFQEIDVYAKVSGYIQKLYVDWGTHVKQGQMLADLEIPELQQQLQQDEATVHRGESDLERAREELNRANSAYNVAHLTYTRLADVQKTQPGLVAQQDIDVSEGKDVEASAGLSAAKDALAAAEQALAGRQSRARKRQGPLRVRAHHRSFRRRGDRDSTPTRAPCLPAGTSSNIGRSGALPSFAKRSAAPGDPRAGKGRAGYSPRRSHRREGLGDGKDLSRKDRALLRPDRHANAHDAHRSGSTQSEIRAGAGNVCIGADSAARRRRTL